MIGARPSPPSVQPSAAKPSAMASTARPSASGSPKRRSKPIAPPSKWKRAGLDAVLEVGSARLTYESAEPRARVDGRTVKPGGAR